MRTTRTAVSITVALALAVTLAVPASAARLIHFDGKTSAAPTWRHVTIDVLKKDDGRRFLRAISIDFTLTCEDATTEAWTTDFFMGAGMRLDDGGEFAFEEDFDFMYFAMDGAIGFRHASGSLLVSAARLTDDHQETQFCTTGELTWTARRSGSTHARLEAGTVADRTGYLRVRVTDGGAEVVKRIEP